MVHQQLTFSRILVSTCQCVQVVKMFGATETHKFSRVQAHVIQVERHAQRGLEPS